MATLEELKKELLADGVIDAAEVAQLKEVLYADGVIDKEEADFLFELNDAVSDKEMLPSGPHSSHRQSVTSCLKTRFLPA